ncbi:MAG: dinitrogenase iron-molybdenum cofactor [Thermodesulfatator sp.]|nr:MAG: dinitrogenase iron-molybdenum cofactor [Thermodesulfatator sp.]
MRIAVACDAPAGLEARVSPHFGKAPFYALLEVEDGQILKVETVSNPYFAHHVPGAVPQFLKGLGVDLIICGGIGPRALTFFEALGIEVLMAQPETSVKSALEAFFAQSLRAAEACKEDHSCKGGHTCQGGRKGEGGFYIPGKGFGFPS